MTDDEKEVSDRPTRPTGTIAPPPRGDHDRSVRPPLRAQLVIWALVVSACDVAIYGTVEPAGDVVRLTEEEGWLASVSVGLLDELTLVEWVQSRVDGEAPTARWFDAELAPVGPPIHLGLGSPWASQFVLHEDELVAQVWASPPGQPWELGDAAYWRFPRPPAEPERLPFALDVVDEEPPFRVLHIGAGGFAVGPEGKLPTAVGAGRLVSAVGATPSACGRDSFRQIHLVPDDRVGRPLNPSLCDEAVPETGGGWLFPLPDGTSIGMLYRERSENGRLRYVQIDADGTLLTSPVVVGLDLEDTHSTVDSGFQPRAVAIGDHVVFTERFGTTNTCHVLRLMNLDGSDARDAPFQLPCRSADIRDFRPGRRVTASIELLRLDAGTLLIYSEHTYAGPETITASYPWSEAIHAVLLDSDGRRGSDVVTVTDTAATALDPIPRTADDGPFATSFFVGAGGSGDRAVVAWYDRRPGGSGIYARSLRIRAH